MRSFHCLGLCIVSDWLSSHLVLTHAQAHAGVERYLTPPLLLSSLQSLRVLTCLYIGVDFIVLQACKRASCISFQSLFDLFFELLLIFVVNYILAGLVVELSDRAYLGQPKQLTRLSTRSILQATWGSLKPSS